MNRFGWLLLWVPALPALGTFAACSAGTASNGTTSGEVTVDGGGTADAEPTTDASSGGTSCTKARDDLLVPVNKVSSGTVSVVSEQNGVKTLYVDASAGGANNAIKNPRIYIDLGAATKVDVTDTTAPASTAWDLALKRDKIFTNSGDAGVGQGGAVEIEKPFASVTAAEANASNLLKEKFFDADCNPQLDQTQTVSTTFANWYDYDQVTHVPSPRNITYVVAGGTGKKYKIAIKAYDGTADGGTSQATGFYLLQVTAL